MNTIRLVAITVGTLLISATAWAVELNEKSLYEFLEATEQSFVEQNIEGLKQALAMDAAITIKIVDKATTQTIDLDRKTYLDSLLQSWDLFDDFTYQRTLVNTTISGDTASVESLVQQQFTVEGERIEQSSSETAQVKVINGQLKLVRVDVLVNP